VCDPHIISLPPIQITRKPQERKQGTHHLGELGRLERLLEDGDAVPLHHEPPPVTEDVALEHVISTEELDDALDEHDLREIGPVRAVAEEVDLGTESSETRRQRPPQGWHKTHPGSSEVVVEVDKWDSGLHDTGGVAGDVELFERSARSQTTA
jgi:hypothetical protein